MAAQKSVLIINPNTSGGMTDALRPLVDKLGYQTDFEYFTAPSGVPSINNEDDAAISAEACLPALEKSLSAYDAFLVCCYSQHPLVQQLRARLGPAGLRQITVTGIFEASVATCLQLLDPHEKFGIVSTGSQWSEILGEAVANLLGTRGAKFTPRYAGTETTGLNADELHSTPQEQVDRRIKLATKRLLGAGAKAICLGCAGMANMDRTVKQACVEHLGEVEGRKIRIVDGVVAGVTFLEGVLRAGI